MSATLRDLLSDNLDFTFALSDVYGGEVTEDSRIDYSFEVSFKKGSFKHEVKGDFLSEITEVHNVLTESDKLYSDILEMILDKCDDLISF